MDQARRQAEREKDLVNVHDTEEKFLASIVWARKKIILISMAMSQRLEMVTKIVLNIQLKPNCCMPLSYFFHVPLSECDKLT